VVTLAIASGLYFSFPVFFVALPTNSAGPAARPRPPSRSRRSVQGVLSPVVGILVDRVGPRRIMLGGAGLLGVGVCWPAGSARCGRSYMVVGVLAATGCAR